MSGSSTDKEDGGLEGAGSVAPGTAKKAWIESLPQLSLGCIPKGNWLRRLCIELAWSSTADIIIVVIVLLNSVTIAMDTNEPGFRSTNMGQAVFIAERVFASIFALEKTLVILGEGMRVHFSSWWNVLDTCIVIAGMLVFLPEEAVNITSLRVARALRPLITLKRMRGVRNLLLTIVDAVPMIFNVTILLAFSYIFFGTFGLYVFNGAFDRRCAILKPDPKNRTQLEDENCADCPDPDGCDFGNCDLDRLLSNGAYFRKVDDADHRLCAAPKASAFPFEGDRNADGRVCDKGQYCVRFGNPDFGLTSFDNFGQTLVYNFQVISTRRLGDLLQYLMDGVSKWASIYVIVLRLVASSFLLSLFIAILFGAFTRRDSMRKALKNETLGNFASASQGISSQGLSPHHGDFRASWRSDSVFSSKRSFGSENVHFDQRSSDHASVGDAVKESCWMRIRKEFRHWTLSVWFNRLALLLILLNAGLLASAYFGMSEPHRKIIVWGNFSMTVIFLVEMSIRIFGLGGRAFCSDPVNVFDGIVVSLTVIDTIVIRSLGLDRFAPLSALRVLRLLALARLSNVWPDLSEVISIVIDSLPSIGRAAILLLFFVILGTLLGMQLFGFRLVFCDSYGLPDAKPMCPDTADDCPAHRDCFVPCDEEERGFFVEFQDAPASGICQLYGNSGLLVRLGASDVPRLNFDTFWRSLITLFTVIHIEGRAQIFIDTMRAQGPAASIYHVVILGAGIYIFVNMFLIVLLQSFSTMRERQHTFQNRNSSSAPNRSRFPGLLSRRWYRSCFLFSPSGRFRKGVQRLVENKAFEYAMLLLVATNTVVIAILGSDIDQSTANILTWMDRSLTLVFLVEIGLRGVAYGFVGFNGAYLHKGWNVLDLLVVLSGLLAWILSDEEDAIGALTVLRAFRALRPLRVAARFSNLRLVIDALVRAVARIADVGVVVFAFLFTFGIIGLSIFLGTYAGCYEKAQSDDFRGELLSESSLNVKEITKSWCQRSPHLVLFPNFTQVSEAGFSFANIRSFDDGESVALENADGWDCKETGKDTFIRGNPKKDRVEMFGGLRWNCTPVAEELVDLYGPASLLSYVEPRPLEHEWLEFSESLNFNDVGRAMLTLFALDLTRLFQGLDANEVDKQPVRNAEPENTIFFIAVIILVKLVAFQLFVAITITEYRRSHRQLETKNTHLLTERQHNWLEMLRLCLAIHPTRGLKKPAEGSKGADAWTKFRSVLFRLSVSKHFDNFFLLVIVVNVGFLASRHEGMSPTYASVLLWQDVAVTFLFVVEVLVKAIAFGVRHLFSTAVNIADLVIVAISVAGVIAQLISGAETEFLTAARLFRLLRISFFVPRLGRLRVLVLTVAFSLSGFWSIVAVSALLLLVFSILTANIFGKIRHHDAITDITNFDNVQLSGLQLFR